MLGKTELLVIFSIIIKFIFTYGLDIIEVILLVKIWQCLKRKNNHD